MKKIFSTIALALALQVVMIGTASAEVRSVRQGLTADPTKFWTRADLRQGIHVCWENLASNAVRRQWVRSAVTRTWQAQSLVRFVGWGKCGTTSRGIRIKVADSGPHVTALGAGLRGKKNGMLLNFTFKNWGKGCQGTIQYCIENIAVHEFGHALGFSHEHNRSDAPGCGDAPQGTNGSYYITKYDLKSVMNYCNPRWNGDGKLSEQDKRGVRWIYGAPGRACSSVPCRSDWVGPAKNPNSGGKWGSWSDVAKCPYGSQAFAYRLKVEPNQRAGDDTALNAVRLRCRASNGRLYEARAGEGPWGRWGPWISCARGRFLTSYEMRVEPKQGKGDDTAANDLRFNCSDGVTIRAGNGARWGRWQRGQNCPRGQVITGLRTRIERKQGAGDDTALNDIDVLCGRDTSGTGSRPAPAPSRKEHHLPSGRSQGSRWGSWYGLQKCKAGTHANGFRLKVEKPQGGGDDTALNGVRLSCVNASGGSRGSNEVKAPRGGEARWGSWGRWSKCPAGQFLTSYEIRVERKQGAKDDTAANDVRFKCSGGSVIHSNNGARWGNWRRAQSCTGGSRICGFRSRVEKSQGGGDDTALNDISVVCCNK